MNPMISVFAFVTAHLGSLADRRDEKGQGTLEYVGIAIVAAILVVAVVDAVTGANIGGAISDQISKITSAG